jgi:hypothetical protein
MSSSSKANTWTLITVAMLVLAACRETRSSSGDLAQPLAKPLTVTVSPACEGDSLRPSTAAPAEGLWLSMRPMQPHVAVMVGPGRAASGDTRVIRRVEIVEVVAVGDTLRREADEASVRLELLPLGPEQALGDADSAATTESPAATYAVGPTIVVAAYEPCAASARVPRLRYLRRDARGRRVTDVMLQRASGS